MARGRRAIAWVAAVALGLASGSAGAQDPGGATITAVQGRGATASGVRGELELRSDVAPGQSVQTSPDAKVSMLLAGKDAVVDICGDTRLSFGSGRGGAGEVALLEGGSLRAFIEPRAPDARLEIHTPAAIAVILGTIVHVEVDEQTGATTVISRDNPVRVRSATQGVPGETTVCCGEAVTIEKGQPPAEKRRLPQRELSGLDDCFLELHRAASALDRWSAERELLDRVARAEEPALPAVASAARLRALPEEKLDPEGVCDPPNCPAGLEPAEDLVPSPGEGDDGEAPPDDDAPVDTPGEGESEGEGEGEQPVLPDPELPVDPNQPTPDIGT